MIGVFLLSIRTFPTSLTASLLTVCWASLIVPMSSGIVGLLRVFFFVLCSVLGEQSNASNGADAGQAGSGPAFLQNE